MRSVRTRVAAVGLVLGIVAGGLALSTGGQAGAESIQYTCTGVTNDVAVKWWQLSYGYGPWNGKEFPKLYKNYSTGQFMSLLGQTINQVQPGAFTVQPVINSDVTISAPANVAPGGSVSPTLSANLTLPDNLIVDAQKYLGVSSLLLRNSTISVNGTQASPASVSGPIPDQTVQLVSGTTLSASVTGPMTATGQNGFMAFSPGVAHVELLLDPVTFPKGKYITNINFNGTNLATDFYVYGLRFNCTPDPATLAYTTISGGTTTTTAAPTTTTAAPTTTTAAPTTTTAAPTTTTAGPTTTLLPGSPDVATITVSGYGYTNTGALTSGNFVVKPGSSVSGGGTLPGKNGGSATVAVKVSQVLFWGFGTVTVSDPGAGLPSTTGYVLFGPAPGKSVSGSGFSFTNNVFKSFTVGLRITDNS